jgi:hypothetical protein
LSLLLLGRTSSSSPVVPNGPSLSLTASFFRHHPHLCRKRCCRLCQNCCHFFRGRARRATATNCARAQAARTKGAAVRPTTDHVAACASVVIDAQANAANRAEVTHAHGVASANAWACTRWLRCQGRRRSVPLWCSFLAGRLYRAGLRQKGHICR